jgi:tetratricopeptide (TPR) repeat protein
MTRAVDALARLYRILLLLLLISAFSYAQAIQPTDSGLGGANTISGTVLGPSGQRIGKHVAVRLATPTRGDRVAVTDDFGNFAFSRVTNGDYVLYVDKESEFEPFSMNVNVFQMRGMPGQNFMVSIRLKSKPSDLGKPAVVDAKSAEVPKAAVDHFNKAVKLAEAGDRKAAIEELEKALAEHPRFMLAHNEIGVQYMRMNELGKADAALLEALKIEPEAFTPLVNRGIVLFMQKRYGEAEPGLRSAVRINGDSAVAHYFFGQVLANLGKFVEAEKELVTALRTGGPEMREAYRLLAIIYSYSGDKERAAGALETYLKLAPNAPDAEQLRQTLKRLKP